MTFIPPQGKTCPTCGQSLVLPKEVIDALSDLAARQEPMDPDLAKVLEENIDKLYEP